VQKAVPDDVPRGVVFPTGARAAAALGGWFVSRMASLGGPTYLQASFGAFSQRPETCDPGPPPASGPAAAALVPGELLRAAAQGYTLPAFQALIHR
jgi:hypothetical protein